MKIPEKTKNRITIWSCYTTFGYMYERINHHTTEIPSQQLLNIIYNTMIYGSTTHSHQSMEST
jgi:hypothetical protein